MTRILNASATLVTWVALVGNLAGAEPAATPSPSSAPHAVTVPRTGITRADLAASYLRLEQTFFARPPEGERAADINRAFDRATLAFFTGRSAQAIEQIDALTDSLLVPPGTLADKAAASLKAVVEPAVWNLARLQPATVRVVSLYETRLASAEDVSLQLAAVDSQGQTIWHVPFTVRCGPKSTVNVSLPIDVPPEKFAPGVYRLELGASGGRKIVVGRFNVVAGPSLDEQRTVITARLDKIAERPAIAEKPQLAQALATCRARAALLSDEPSPANSAQFLADLNSLSRQVIAEADALEAGHDPYERRVGDYWRVLQAGGGEIPLRVYAPEAATQEPPLPLLIVLHGAGGDENMFPEAYGAGIIKRIADKHGLLIASPSTYRFGSNPQRIAELVDALSYDYAIDRSRIYVLGHSMGAAAVAALIRGQAKTIAAACCMAGGNSFQSSNGIPPLLVLLAEFDGVVPVKAVQTAAERAQLAKLPVELKIIPNYGHTLVVGRELEATVEWLLKHRQP